MQNSQQSSSTKFSQFSTVSHQLPAIHTTTVQNHIDKTQIDSSLIKNPTEHPDGLNAVNRSENAGRQQSDLLKQINMQIILSSNDLQDGSANTKDKSTSSTSTTTPVPTTATFSATQPAAAPQIVYEPGESFFGEISDVFEDMFSPQSEEDDDDDGSSSEEDSAQPTKTVTEIYHYYDSTTPSSQRTTQSRTDDSSSIIYAMPPPYAGYPAYSYQDPQPIQTIYRNKRTTLQPGGYQHQVGPQQIVTTNADGTKKKNYMSTQIHVTSEYNPGPTMSLEEAAMALKKKGVKFEESSEEDGNFFGLNGFSFSGGETDEEDEDSNNGVKENAVDSTDDGEYEEEDDGDDLDDLNDEFEVAVGEDYSESVHRMKKIKRRPPLYEEYTPEVDNQAPNPIKRRRKIRKPVKRLEEYSDEYSYEDRNSGLVPQHEEESAPGFFGNLFGDFFAPISWLWPSTAWSPLRMFSSGLDESGDEATTPRNEFRHPKQPSSGDSMIFSDLSSNDLGEDGHSWLNPFAVANDEVGTTPMSVQSTTESSSGFWGWFGGGDDAEPTELDVTEVPTAESGNQCIFKLLHFLLICFYPVRLEPFWYVPRTNNFHTNSIEDDHHSETVSKRFQSSSQSPSMDGHSGTASGNLFTDQHPINHIAQSKDDLHELSIVETSSAHRRRPELSH